MVAVLPLTIFIATSCASASASETAVAQGTVVTPARTDTTRINTLMRVTAPNEPLQVAFAWAMQDRDFKFSGKGLVRMQGAYHARLDLFGLQDIQVARVVLIGDSVEIVYSGPRVPLPPVAFLWAVVGAFRAPVAGPPASFKADGNSFEFGYDPAPAHWRFRADSTTLRSAEWTGDDGGRRTVELSGPFRFNRPSKAVYRDWREFRELTITVTAVEKVDSFASDIWNVSNQ